MSALDEALVACPYCGERIVVEVDVSVPQQEYVEDCSVCCRPIRLRVRIDPDGPPEVEAHREDD